MFKEIKSKGLTAEEVILNYYYINDYYNSLKTDN